MKKYNYKMYNIIIAVLLVMNLYLKLYKSIPYELSVPNQTLREENIGDILQMDKISQSFVADEDDLNGINIRVSTYMKENTSRIKFNIKDESNAILDEFLIDCSKLIDNSIETIKFKNQTNSKGKLYTIEFEPIDVKPGDCVTFWVSKKDTYLNGNFKINNEYINKDLVFNTLYLKNKYEVLKHSLNRMNVDKFFVIVLIFLLTVISINLLSENFTKYNE